MGSSQSGFYEGGTEGRKKVVIVGAQHAGRICTLNLLQFDPGLKNIEVLLIDKQPDFELIWGMYQVFTDKDYYEGKLVISHEEAVKSYGNPNVKFMQGMCTKVNSDENKIEVDTTADGPQVIDYDVLLIATGGSLASPLKAPDQEVQSKDQRSSDIAGYRDQVKPGAKILVVGAGSTGCETACYIKEAQPEAQVTICTGGDKLLPQFPNGHKEVMKVCDKLGIKALTNTRYEKGGPMDEQYDCILDCMGFKFTAPGYFMQDKLATCLDKKTGQILVNSKCQVTNVHPFVENHKPEEVILLKNVFSMGDTCLTPSNEIKSVVSMYQYAHVVALNILAVAKGGAASMDIPSALQFHKMQFIPLGTKNGLACFNNAVSVKNDAHNEKLKIINMTMGCLKGDPKAFAEAAKQGKDMPQMFGCCSNNICCCCPCHISKSKADT